MSVLTIESAPEFIDVWAGEKGRNLHRLTLNGVSVPDWAVIGLDVFQRFLREADLSARLAQLLTGITATSVSRTSAAIEELICSAPLSPEGQDAVGHAYAAVGAGDVAVRSSGNEEDGAQFSFAGQFKTFLNVRGLDEVINCVRLCWASVFSEQALRYRLSHGLDPANAGVAVILQRLVPADKSGVVFTANPANGRRDEMMISSVFGLGEALVSGAVDADTIVVGRHDQALKSLVIGDKLHRQDPAPGGRGVAVSAVDENAAREVSLSDAEITELQRVAAQIEEIFQSPQDIEWSYCGAQLQILQARPITSFLGTPGDTTRIWDNSNIIESFDGITSPLTYSFAKLAYERIYEGYARALNVPRRELEQAKEWLPAMLGYFNGRVYYNLLNWYRMARLAPLYSMNRKVLELALGVQEPLDDVTAESLYPYVIDRPVRKILVKLVTNTTFAWRFVTINHSVKRFLDVFYKTYRTFDHVDYDALPPDEVYRRFRSIERGLIAEWGPMMVLDAVIGLSFGVLNALTARWLPQAPDWFRWAAANPGFDVESAEPARRLIQLSQLIEADSAVKALLATTAPEQSYQALVTGGHARVLAEVDSYLADFGYRSPDELKLEVPDLREDPSSLFRMLHSGAFDHDRPDTNHAGTGPDQAAEYLDQQLRGVRRLIYRVVQRRVQKAFAAREKLRFCRTRAFGMAKRQLRAIGRGLARINAVDDWRDVFYLRLEELTGAIEGTISHGEIKPLIALRKQQQEEHALLSAPARFTTSGLPYWLGNLELAGWTRSGPDLEASSELRGTPSCGGVAEAEARVLTSPLDVEGGVLVTYRTDPGWVPVLPSASALLIERGSPLTHVAIVAREFGLPTVVQIPDLTRHVTTGMRLRVNGSTGLVQILEQEMR